MSRQGGDKMARPVPVAKGQLPLFPPGEDGAAWWTQRPEVTVDEPSESEEVGDPWGGEGSGQSGALVPGTETSQ